MLRQNHFIQDKPVFFSVWPKLVAQVLLQRRFNRVPAAMDLNPLQALSQPNGNTMEGEIGRIMYLGRKDTSFSTRQVKQGQRASEAFPKDAGYPREEPGERRNAIIRRSRDG